MPHDAKSVVEIKMSEAALRLASKAGWHALTLDGIAKAAKIAPARARNVFRDKNQILPAIVRRMDRRAAAILGKGDARAKPHDRLFELMMARFDALQENRKGILAIVQDCRRDPSLVRLIFPAQMESMRQILAQAGLPSKGAQEPLAIAALLAVYYRTIWCWYKDNTLDMARTMAALDQGLRYAGKAAEILFRVL